MRPPQIVVLVFLALVLTGSAILCLPVCSKSAEPTRFLTALFTATSATCVTGLIPVDTGTYWSTFGQVVIILLIQLGGLGFMTVSTIFFLALRRRIGLRQRMVLAQGLGVSSMSGVVRYVRNVILGTFCVEGAGALILFSGSCRNLARERLYGTACSIRFPRSAMQALTFWRMFPTAEASRGT